MKVHRELLTYIFTWNMDGRVNFYFRLLVGRWRFRTTYTKEQISYICNRNAGMRKECSKFHYIY